MNEELRNIGDAGVSSCDPNLTRKEFIEKIVKSAATVGGLMVAAQITDSFMVPAYASGVSSCSTADTGGSGADIDTGGNTDVATNPVGVGDTLSGTICGAGGS
ncbi:MAG: hypothetical protein ACRD3W_26735 [Terriglobales bacterium]